MINSSIDGPVAAYSIRFRVVYLLNKILYFPTIALSRGGNEVYIITSYFNIIYDHWRPCS